MLSVSMNKIKSSGSVVFGTYDLNMLPHLYTCNLFFPLCLPSHKVLLFFRNQDGKGGERFRLGDMNV